MHYIMFIYIIGRTDTKPKNMIKKKKFPKAIFLNMK